MRTFRKDGQTIVAEDFTATLFLREGWEEVKEETDSAKAEDAPVTAPEAEPDTPKRRRRKAN